MPDKHIYCEVCNKYLGVIRDAKLYKWIIFLCEKCHRGEDDFGKIFGGFMRGK